MTRNHDRRADAVIKKAEHYEGYRSRAAKVNVFGEALASNGQAWAGAFLEIVMRESGEKSLPNLNATTAALSEFLRTNRNRTKPRRGDLVFYAFSTDHEFAQPHIGLVTDVSKWKDNRSFQAIEGQTATGLPKGPQEKDGVYKRTRHETDVLAFVRPAYQETVRVAIPENRPKVTVIDFIPGKSTPSTVLLQQALHDVVRATGMRRGVLDRATVAALARYQRRIGYTGERAGGVPDETTLRRLALETDFVYFTVKGVEP